MVCRVPDGGGEEAGVCIAESLVASGRFDDAMAVRIYFMLHAIYHILYTMGNLVGQG